MYTTARNVLALSALILLPLLEAYCPRLAPDVISGKIIPCRYLCIRINFFELPSIILSTERDGVLCSTLLLRRRGVCKNGGCYPFESEDQKRRGMFRRVITNIDKYASGSYKKPVEKPGAQSGPIVSVIPSLLGGRTKDTANDTSPPASGLPPSSPALPSLSAGTTSLVKSVGSTLTSIWAQAFPFNLKAGPPRRPTAANTPPSSNPQQAPGGMSAHSGDETSISGIGGGPPVVPPLPTEGRSNQSPPTGPSLGSNLFGRMPRLSSALTLSNTLMKLRGKSSAPTPATGSSISPVAGINAIKAGSIKEGVPGESGGPSVTNTVNIGGALPTAVPPAPPGSNGERPTPATMPGTASPRVIPGLLSAIGLGGALATSQGEKTRPGLLGSLISSASATDVRNSARTNEGISANIGGMSHSNENSPRSPPAATPVTTEGNGNINVASGTPPRIRPFGLISKLRTTAALRNAINKWKQRHPESGAAPRIPSSPASQGTAVTNTGTSKASSRTSQDNFPGANRGVPTNPSVMAPGTSNEVSPSMTPRGGRSAGIIPELSSAIALGGILSTSRGKNSGSNTVPNRISTSRSEVSAGNAKSNNELSVTAGSIVGTSGNYPIGQPNATPVETPGRSDNRNAASGAPPVTLSPEATPERSAVVPVNKIISESQDVKAPSGVAPVNPSLPVAASGSVNPLVARVSHGVPGVTLRAPGGEITGQPAAVSQSTEPEKPRAPQIPTVSSLTPGGSVTLSATPPVPESSSSAGSSKVAGSTVIKTPHETHISPVEGEARTQPPNATPSVGPPVGGAEATSVSTATRGTEETSLRAPNGNAVLPPNNTLPGSKPAEITAEIPATTGKPERRSTLFSRLQNVRAAVTSPVTGGGEASRTFVRNLLGGGLRRRLIS
uniref:7DB family member n=1 Tax=Rhipicephalus appendiculatus TaxID=34631 RepID=A0A131YLK9_RHIAP